MQTGSGYIIDVTNELLTKKIEHIDVLAHDLRLIRKAIPELSSIVLRGGGAYDLLLGLEPSDIDLFYAFADNSTECKCEAIQSVINVLPLKYIKGKDVDLENSYEKEPRLSPIERTVGHFSYHSDYNSMFVIDEEGRVWTNIRSLDYFKQGVYEINYAGFLPWAYYPHTGDSHNYFAFYCYITIRGLGYVIKRNLKVGPLFKELLSESRYILSQCLLVEDPARIRKYRDKKIPDKQKAYTFIANLDFGESSVEVRKALLDLMAL